MVWCHLLWDLINTAVYPGCGGANKKLSGISVILQHPIKLCLPYHTNRLLSTAVVLLTSEICHGSLWVCKNKQDPLKQRRTTMYKCNHSYYDTKNTTRTHAMILTAGTPGIMDRFLFSLIKCYNSLFYQIPLLLNFTTVNVATMAQNETDISI
jgi:hypothetical protein